mmetsp:Transcript_47418/g.103745  ORF Transcript_47418/g.103745 Transcript_47418/m.103745 type:complete len:690 (-) Transcript_47418:162-2231(-)
MADSKMAGPDAPEHLAVLKGAFQFKGYIDHTEHRAITLGQLEHILFFAKEHAGSWYDTAPPAYSKTSGQALSLDFLNLYQFNTWVILPSTKEADCAFVELFSGEKQTPVWFCSHWWGEAIQDFIACIETHANHRLVKKRNVPVPKDVPYWVCAYANRQHSLAQELVEDPKQTSFYKAMQLAVGTLVILDRDGPAIAFTRIWCAFEEYVSLMGDGRTSPMLLDIATVTANGKADLLTDGPTQKEGGRTHGGKEKASREKFFPTELLLNGIKVDFSKANASVEDDKTRILNCLAQRDLHLPPLDEHENYDKVNRKLHATFAFAAFNKAIFMPGEKDLITSNGLPEIIAADDTMRTLQFDFGRFVELIDTEVQWVAACFPNGLKELILGFQSNSQITDNGFCAIANNIPDTLELLELEMTDVKLLTDKSFSMLCEKLPTSLKNANLKFGGNEKISSNGIESLAKTAHQGLEVLDLTMKLCDKGVEILFTGLGNFSALRTLHIDLSCCNLSMMGFACVENKLPASLEEFQLNSSYCKKVTADGFASLGNLFSITLKALIMNIESSFELGDEGVSRFADHLGKMQSMEKLQLCFSGCRVTDAGFLALAARLPPAVKHLNLKFDDPDVTDEAGANLSKNLPPYLETLELKWKGGGPKFQTLDLAQLQEKFPPPVPQSEPPQSTTSQSKSRTCALL